MARAAEQADQVVELARNVLGPDLVGAYLHGSATLGGLRPRSDVDVLVVARRRMTDDEKRELVRRLFEVSGAPRPVELTVVVQSEVRPWRYPPRMDLQYGEWVRAEFERGNLAPEPLVNPDLAVLLTMVLRGNRPLAGPPPAEVLDPVPRADYVRAMVDGLDGILKGLDGSDTRNTLLTLARIWSTVATDVIRSKDAAAEWALERLPTEHQAVLTRARAIYLGEREERWEDLTPRLRPHAEYVAAEVRRLAAEDR